MNPISKELNDLIKSSNPYIFEMLSSFGKEIYFPKGILKQTAEAKQKAGPLFNATIGMATEHGETFFLPSIMKSIKDIKHQDVINYSSSYGILSLREVWQKEIYKKTPSLASKKISLPIVTNGMSHGINIFSNIFIDSGDTILLSDKTWGNYKFMMCVKGGGSIVSFDMFKDGVFNLKAFEDAIYEISKKSDKIIIPLNFPNNPTGYNLSENEANEIASILFNFAEKGLKIVTFADDAYFNLNYEETQKESIFGKLTNLHEKIVAVKIDGITKEAFAWGLRIGFITYGIKSKNEEILYDALEQKTAGDIRASISNISTLSQSIALKALKDANYNLERENKISILQKRYKKVLKVVDNEKFSQVWKPYPCNSGYFISLKLKTVDAEILRLHLLDKYKVGIISMNKRDIRVAFSCIDIDKIESLFNKIFSAINSIT